MMVPTKVSLIEFRSNNDREVAIRMLLNSHEKDLIGANIDFKRARTALQRQRNDNLVKAEALVKKAAKDTDQVKIKWQERQVECNANPAYIQNKEGNSGRFLAPFSDLHF